MSLFQQAVDRANANLQARARRCERAAGIGGCAGGRPGRPPIYDDQIECYCRTIDEQPNVGLRPGATPRRTPSVFRANTARGASSQNIALGFYNTFQDPQHAFVNGPSTLGLLGTQMTFGNQVVALTDPCDPRRLPNRGPGRKPSVFRCCTNRCAAAQSVELGFTTELPSPEQRNANVGPGCAGACGANSSKTYGNLVVQWSYRSAIQ